MSKTEDFIGLLHVIAAGEGPEDHQKLAIQQVLARFVSDLQQLLVRATESEKSIRNSVSELGDALAAETKRAYPGRLGVLVDHASELVRDWLRKN
jgi:hypothetical protein